LKNRKAKQIMNHCFKVTAILAIFIGFNHVIVTADTAPDINSPEPVVKKIASALPAGWTYDSEPAKMILRRIEEPIIVNLFQAEPPNTGETRDHWVQKHKVNIKYRINIRFVHKMDPEQVQKLKEENQNIQHEIEKLGRISTFAMNPEQKELQKKYKKLAKSLNKIPNGHLEGVSVFIEPTFLGYAEFLNKDVAAESKSLIEQVAKTLNPYPDEPKEGKK
jgi:hypothetical protein